VTTFVRVLTVVMLVLLAVVAVSLVVSIGTADTGWAEKSVLAVLLAGCLAAASRTPAFAIAVGRRLTR
jgi:branched-subunit amino acid transport protein